jgi:DNA-binding NtrC family response regulator
MIDFLAATAETAQSPFRETGVEPLVLLGNSPGSKQLREAVSRAAFASGPVLVVGEPGSGKSVVARTLHEHGPRSTQHCAVVQCNALSASEIEEELFGGTLGSASRSAERRGALEVGNGGTVILEQAESIPRRTQAQLARFLDSGLVKGGRRVARLNTRLIATCTQPPSPKRDCDRGLWTQLAGNTIRVPSLRERHADIPGLAQFFALNTSSRDGKVAFAADALHALCEYSWPGNLTELRRVVERLASAGGRESIQAHDLPVGIRPRRPARRPGHDGRSSVGEQLFARVQRTGESFWSAVYPLFMHREITRRDLRDLIRRALDVARDNRDLLRVLNMPSGDRRRFESFLRKYDCALAPRGSAERD